MLKPLLIAFMMSRSVFACLRNASSVRRITIMSLRLVLGVCWCFCMSSIFFFPQKHSSAFAQSVTTFAGSGTAGLVNNTGVLAQFNQPNGIAIDGSGNLYVADKLNHCIRRITPLGVVTTFAGTGASGWAEGAAASAQFNQPTGVAVDGAGNVYVADFGNHRIRKISAGVVSTFAGSGVGGFSDATGTLAQFQFPTGVAVDGAGNVYVADYINNRIRRITALGVVTTLAGSATAGSTDGMGAGAQFNLPVALAVNGAGTIVYVADQNNHRIRAVTTAAGAVTTLAGNTSGYADGTGSVALFNSPTGISVNGAGNILVAENGGHRIRIITPGGIVTTLAGSGAASFLNAVGTAAQFNAPSGVVMDASGNAYVADLNNHRIRAIGPAPVPTITGFTPTTGGAGTLVTINGTNFTGASAVSFGGVAATSFTVVNATQITATIGAGGMTGNIAVTTPGGTALSVALFTFIPPPSITSFTPMSQGGGMNVTIVGTNLGGATLVSFGGVPATIVSNSGTMIVATVAAGGGSGNVVVTTPGGTATQGGFTFIPAPTITSFAPTSAAAGASVVITGTNLSGATLVSFGGVPATITANTATSITATVGIGATGNVLVTNPGGTVTQGGFTFLAPPTVTGFAPMSRGPGMSVTITGTNFVAPATVTFGGVAATSVVVVSATQITCNVGALGASGFVQVTTPNGVGTSNPMMFTFVPAPTITSFTPATGAVGTVITINGSNLGAATAVTVGGTPASINTNTASVITATVGAGTTGLVAVSTAGGTVNSATTFTFAAPTIAGFLPTMAAAGAMVVITGNNFTGATQVQIGGVNCPAYTVNSNTQITVTVPAGAVTGVVRVTTPGGGVNSAGTFTFLAPPPTITSFTPASGGNTTVVSIFGTNFQNVTAVSFGGTAAASHMVVSPMQINATVGAGMTGTVQVTTLSAPPANSATNFTWHPAPTITSFTPAVGIAGTVVTITGTNFTPATQVNFGGTAAASFTVDSPTQITAALGLGSSGAVQVVSPGGTVNSATNFTFMAPVPTITNFTPTSGGNGTVVTITGTNFFGATVVRFGGTPASSFTVVSATQINAMLAAGASGAVQVVTPGGTATQAGFTWQAAPSITSYSPNPAGATTVVTINGNNFVGTTTVTFGGINAAAFTVVSPTVITAVVPAGATTPLVVRTPGGMATAATAFTFAPAPTITGFTPMTAGAGATITINGTNFAAGTSVSFGGVPAMSVNVVNSMLITAVVGAGASGNVTVSNVGGSVNAAGFTFIAAPTITSFSPTAGVAGTVVTINGTNLGGVTQVRFGNVVATGVTPISATQLTAVVGAGASGNVEVVTPGGTGVLGGFVHSASAPSILGFVPTSAGNGATVVITGNNFTGATQVQFGGVNAAYVVNSNTQITAVVGAGASGSVTVTTPGGSAPQGGFTFIPPPTITTFTPTSAGLGNVMTINGTGFTPTTQVEIGGVSVPFTVVSATQITATVGTGATANVSVIGPGGTVTQGGFTYLYFTPTIANFTPTSQGGGNTVTINGTNFVGVTGVNFGGMPAMSFSTVSPTQVTARVGAAGASGNVQMTTLGGVATLGGFTYIPAPVVSSFTPTSRGMGQTVTIIGNNFTGATGVSFGGVPAITFMVMSSTVITATVDAGASGSVEVTSAFGTGSLTGFTYLLPPNPVLLTPSSAAAGAIVIITGTNFTGTTAVSFGGVPAASFIIVSPTQINAVVAAGSASGNVVVTGPGGPGTLGGFTFIAPPTISSFAPTSAGAGATVLINGSFFTGTTAVSFGGVPAASFLVIGPGLLSAVVPAGAASGNIQVTTPGGTISASGFTFLPGPTITGISPTSAGPTMTVVITGSGFTGVWAVNFGGVPATSFSVVSATQINAVVAGGASGNVSVTGPGGTSNFAGFTWVPTPVITSFMPVNAAPGAVVTLTGMHFTGATQVRFGGVPATSFTVISPTQINATVAAGSTTGAVSVTTAGGIGNLAGFTYLAPPPTITSFTPGTAGVTMPVVINGTFLSGATAVSFGGTLALTYSVMSDNQIIATVGVGTSGMVQVTTPGGIANSAGFIFAGTPTITSFTPTIAASGATITINGTNFPTLNAVNFGNFPAASYMLVSPTQITAVLGANATSGSIMVATSGGTASLAGFTFLAAPTISAFAPASAGPGINVLITGTNFTGVTGVLFGGVPASMWLVVSPTQILATVPVGGMTGVVQVNTTGGVASRIGFTFVPAPIVSGFTPASAGTGAPVTVTGANFTGAVSVRFGGIAATNFTVNSPSQITAVVAAGASGAVSVQTLGGTSATAGFTFVNNPTITSIAPTSGEPGAVITFTGTNFTGATAVNFGGRPATTFTVISATQMTAVVPVNAGDPITVSTPGGTGSISGFVYLPAPRLTSFTPVSAGVGQTITIFGANFAAVTDVRIGGVPAERFAVVSPSQITAIVSAEGASGSISVTSPDGTATLAGFTFQFPMPTIADFTPKTAGPGATITISGTGFLSVSAATFGGVDAQRFAASSSREITATVSANGASGAVSVRTPGGTATLQGFIFVPVPVITSIAPQSAIVGTTVTITGQNLANVTAITFGGVPAMFTIVSPNEIRVVVSGSGAIALTNPGGTTTSSAFTTLPPPTIVRFTPTSSGSNATITISGFNFTGASRVSFGEVTAASFRVVSPNQIIAVVATGSTGNVSVTTTAGTASVAGYTFVPEPTITDVSPRESGEGLRVVISGTNLSTVQNVWFGGVTAASVSALSQTRIEAVVGNGATGRVTVATLGGVASSTGIVFVSTPVVASISPQTGEVGTTVRIVGRNFAAVRSVRFGGLAAGSFTIVSDSVITAVIGANSSNGTVSVVSAGGAGVSTQMFSFVAPPPRVQGFSPTTAGSGMRIFVSGANFVGVRDVRFGGVSAARFTVFSPTELEAFITTASTGSVQVITQTGTAELGGFAFLPPAQVLAFAPSRAGAGQTVVIDGENFINVSAVSFGGVSAASFSVLANRITATLATGATGEVRVTALGGSGSRSGFTFAVAPTILSFTPTISGRRGMVTITGANFTDASEVRFGGMIALRHEVVSDTRINAIVSDGARSGAVFVRTPIGTDSLPGFVFVDSPVIDGFMPIVAAPTNIITITGINFTTTAQVSFGGVLSPNVVVVSPTLIRASVPQGTTGGTITVLTLGGTASRNGFSLLAPPRITSFSPTRASSGTVIAITGVNFAGLSEVRFGGVLAASFVRISDTQATAVVAAGSSSGNVSITASSGTIELAGFRFIAPPVVSGFTPRGAGAGMAVTIIGANFTQASAVSFGGAPAARFTLVSPTQITAILSSGATGEVAVTAEGGTGTRAGFSFIPQPGSISFTPSVGGLGTVIVVTGRAFTGASSVVIGNVSVPFTVNSDTQISVVIPLSGAASGTITITSAGGVGISQQTFRYVPPPSIASAVFVQSRQGLILRISGENFTGTQNVNIGRTNVPFTIVNPAQLTASIPAGVTPNDVVTVMTQGGMARTEGMPALPAITGVSPARGRPGTRITITGRNLAGTTQASIGGVNVAITPQMVGATQVTLTVPPEGVSGVIGLTTPLGVVSSTTSFTLITSAPLITSFTPTRGDVGTVLQVFGENFGTVTSVFIGGVAIPFRLISVNEMTLFLPRTGALPSGSIIISSPTGVASSQDRFVFTPGGIDTTPPATPQGIVRTYPNPAPESLTIAYNLATPQIVTLRIMDMRGNVLRVIQAGAKDAGEQSETLDVRDYPPGTYLVALETPIQRVQTLFTVLR
ncbi:MAG: T9SS C-terminal target domain-containing protein [Candidatus Kapaibacterium sp.]|nr:MAG: T9SS C-terminal target domain-containing protein [Candidatus Kapabacteria bacterium]